VGQRVLGVLNVESPQIGAFGPEEERLLTALAGVAAIALENARLFQELKELKRFHEGIVNTLAEGVVVVDPEGRILFANPAASEILGWSREEMLGKNWRDLVAPLFHRQVEEELRRRREGKEGAYETLLLHKSGRHIPAFVHARPLFTDGQFHGAVKAFSDISQIKEFETRYRYFAEEIQEGYFLVRAKKPVPVDLPVEEQLRLIRENFYLAEANEAMARAYRLPSAQQILGRGFSELLCEEMFAQMRHLFEEFVRNNYSSVVRVFSRRDFRGRKALGNLGYSAGYHRAKESHRALGKGGPSVFCFVRNRQKIRPGSGFERGLSDSPSGCS